MDVLKIREMLKQAYTKNALVDIREQSFNHVRMFTKAKVKSVLINVVEIEMDEELYRIKYDNIISIHIHDNLITFDDDYEIFSLSFMVGDLKQLLLDSNLQLKDEKISLLLNDRRFGLLKDSIKSLIEEKIKETLLQITEPSLLE